MSSFGVKVFMWDGSVEKGYLVWSDSMIGNEDLFPFRKGLEERYPPERFPAYVRNFKRRAEIPMQPCDACDDSVFQIWMDLFNLKASRHFAGLEYEVKSAVFLEELAEVGDPVNYLVTVRGRERRIPVLKIKKIEFEPTLSEREDLCGLPDASPGLIKKINGGAQCVTSTVSFTVGLGETFILLSLAGAEVLGSAESDLKNYKEENHFNEHWKAWVKRWSAQGIQYMRFQECD